MFSYAKARHFRKFILCSNFQDLSFFPLIIGKCRGIKKIHFYQACKANMKVTATVEADVLSKLEAEEMRHRQHPGVRKTQCYQLPERLCLAADKVLSKYDTKLLTEDIKKFNKAFWHRSLPMETSELQMRTMDMMEKMNIDVSAEDANVHQDSMKKMAVVRKRLQQQLKRWKQIDYTDYVCVTYLGARLAQNYSCISKVFSEIMAEEPSFNPKTFFDFGSGVGSAVWAAYELWGSSLQEYFCVDASAEMNTLAEVLLQGGETDSPTFLKELYFRQFLPSSSVVKYDLVVSAFSMLDLPSMKERMKVIDILWQKTNDTLVIIENGGNTGFSIILDARDYILQLSESSKEEHKSEVHVVAPCPHDLTCPLFVTKKICHFPVSYYQFYPRKDSGTVQKTHMSYVVLKKGKRKEDKICWPRITKPVLKRPRQAHCGLCCPDGKYHEIIFTKKKHGRHAYRCARQSSHGDFLPFSITDQDLLEGSQEEQNGFQNESQNVNTENEEYMYEEKQ